MYPVPWCYSPELESARGGQGRAGQDRAGQDRPGIIFIDHLETLYLTPARLYITISYTDRWDGTQKIHANIPPHTTLVATEGKEKHKVSQHVRICNASSFSFSFMRFVFSVDSFMVFLLCRCPARIHIHTYAVIIRIIGGRSGNQVKGAAGFRHGEKKKKKRKSTLAAGVEGTTE